MAKDDLLGSFEQLVLLAVMRLGDQAYGMRVRREIERRTGRDVALGAVYATLERLQEKGYVSSRSSEGGSERGGRARRFFRMHARGLKVLQGTLAVLDAMREELPGAGSQTAGARA